MPREEEEEERGRSRLGGTSDEAGGLGTAQQTVSESRTYECSPLTAGVWAGLSSTSSRTPTSKPAYPPGHPAREEDFQDAGDASLRVSLTCRSHSRALCLWWAQAPRCLVVDD